jgi:hypothetical protein
LNLIHLYPNSFLPGVFVEISPSHTIDFSKRGVDGRQFPPDERSRQVPIPQSSYFQYQWCYTSCLARAAPDQA